MNSPEGTLAWYKKFQKIDAPMTHSSAILGECSTEEFLSLQEDVGIGIGFFNRLPLFEGGYPLV